MTPPIGKQLSPTLEEIEEALWDFEFNRPGDLPGYTDKAFRAAVKIFSSAILERAFIHHKDKNSNKDKTLLAAYVYGVEIKKLVKKATGIHMPDLYKKP